MSETLGPIHYLMYEKIKYQDVLTAKLLADRPERLAKLNQLRPPVPERPLETLIDQPNIHGWLSARIDIVESRLAYALLHTPAYREIMRDAGRAAAQAAGQDWADCAALQQALMPYLLDGMPCDGALLFKQESGQEVLWLWEEKDMHSGYAAEPLETDPEDSLGKTCAGRHDHDEHHNFRLQEIAEPLRTGTAEGEASRFGLARLAWLEGFLQDTPWQVSLAGGRHYRISRREADVI